MAISWNIEGCTPPRVVSERERVELAVLLKWAAVVLMRDLTPENISEWCARIQFAQRLGNSAHASDPMPMLQRWLGLTTNVQEGPRDEFLSLQGGGFLDDVCWQHEVDAMAAASAE